MADERDSIAQALMDQQGGGSIIGDLSSFLGGPATSVVSPYGERQGGEQTSSPDISGTDFYGEDYTSLFKPDIFTNTFLQNQESENIEDRRDYTEPLRDLSTFELNQGWDKNYIPDFNEFVPGSLSEQMGNQDIYNQMYKLPELPKWTPPPPAELPDDPTWQPYFDQGRNNTIAEDNPPYFDPNLNAGTMGYDPYANPLLNPQPPADWLPDPNSFNGYIPQSVSPGGTVGADAPWNIPDVPMQLPDVPDWRGPDPIIDPTIPRQGFLDFDPYSGGQTGIPGSYAAPGPYGSNRRAML